MSAKMSGQRSHQQWAPPRPSPLALVQNSRPISQDPTMGLVRDPKFWKRFSTAIHLTEDLEKGGSLRSASTFEVKDGDDWLAQQHKEKRRCRLISAIIALVIVILIAGATATGIWFSKHPI